jgi:hypothetical protein
LVLEVTPIFNCAVLEPPTTLAVMFVLPRILGFHVQLATFEVDAIFMQPGICLPLIKKRTLPSDESVAWIMLSVR